MWLASDVDLSLIHICGMTMITLAVFCKCTGRKGWMLYVPVVFLLCCAFTSLVQSAMGCMAAVQAYGFFGTCLLYTSRCV